jgi:hypothetical protein
MQTEKDRQQKVEATWQKLEKRTGENIAVLKAPPQNAKIERVRGIQI